MDKVIANNPLFTVIVRTYNRAHLLPRAIRSVLNQSYQNFELIIIDDCSNDNTEQVVGSFSDGRIIYHKNQSNLGFLVRNIGFSLAQGKYYGYLDDDDELLPNALATATTWLNKLSSQGVKMVWFNMIDAETKRFSGTGLRNEGYISFEDLLCERIRGDYWQTLDMDLIRNDMQFTHKYGEDRLLWLRLFRQSRAYYVPQILYRAYRQHGGTRVSGSSNYQLKHLSTWVLLQKVFLDEFGEKLNYLCPTIYKGKLAQLCFGQILNGDKVRGRKTLLQSLRLGFSLKLCALYLLSFILNENHIKLLYVNYNKLSRVHLGLFPRLVGRRS